MDYSGGYESFYEGGYSSLNSDYGNFVGYRLKAGELSQSINPTTANQVSETSKALKTGLQEVEVQMLGPSVGNNVDQQIPKEHFKEMKQLLKLSGARASLHGPIIEPSGYGQRGQDETQRLEAQRRFVDAVEKAHELNVDTKKPIPVVFHASNGMPGHLYVPDESKKPGEKGRLILQKSYAINKESGEVQPLEREKKYYPTYPESFKDGGVEQEPLDQINSINETSWDRSMTELAQFNKFADEVIGSSPVYLKDYENSYVAQDEKKKLLFVDKDTNKAKPANQEEEIYYNKMRDADIFLENVRLNFSSSFDKAYKYGSDKQRKELNKLAEKFSNNISELRGDEVWQPVMKKEILRESIADLQKITSDRLTKEGKRDPNWGAPKIFESTEDFALDKSSETFSEVALESYKKFKNMAPVMALENYEPGTAFNRAEDLKNLIEETRKKFAKKLHDKENIGMSQAKEIAKNQIGATWDVGHVNLGKRFGYTDEDVVRETEKIAPVLKHLHLTDNFGFSDSHLIPGMGNVPFKKHLEKLEKAGVLDKVRKVVEAGGYIQQIAQRGVHGETASAFGSPIYGAKMASYWNQAQDTMGSYFGGYGTTNPSIHHNVYGAGFSNLPVELGGNIPGGGSRFSGNSLS